MAILVPPDFPDLNEPAGLRQVIGKLREDGLATFSGVSDRAQAAGGDRRIRCRVPTKPCWPRLAG
jgi:hypothetical protein